VTSSIYPVDFVVNTPTINSGTNILSTPITITSEQVSPGGGALLRLFFSFTMAATATISVRDGTGATLIGELNADNETNVESNGYYRFDIDVEVGDTINLRSTQNITAVNRFRVHLVQFGA